MNIFNSNLWNSWLGSSENKITESTEVEKSQEVEETNFEEEFTLLEEGVSNDYIQKIAHEIINGTGFSLTSSSQLENFRQKVMTFNHEIGHLDGKLIKDNKGVLLQLLQVIDETRKEIKEYQEQFNPSKLRSYEITNYIPNVHGPRKIEKLEKGRIALKTALQQTSALRLALYEQINKEKNENFKEKFTTLRENFKNFMDEKNQRIQVIAQKNPKKNVEDLITTFTEVSKILKGEYNPHLLAITNFLKKQILSDFEFNLSDENLKEVDETIQMIVKINQSLFDVQLLSQIDKTNIFYSFIPEQEEKTKGNLLVHEVQEKLENVALRKIFCEKIIQNEQYLDKIPMLLMSYMEIKNSLNEVFIRLENTFTPGGGFEARINKLKGEIESLEADLPEQNKQVIKNKSQALEDLEKEAEDWDKANRLLFSFQNNEFKKLSNELLQRGLINEKNEPTGVLSVKLTNPIANGTYSLQANRIQSLGEAYSRYMIGLENLRKDCGTDLVALFDLKQRFTYLDKKQITDFSKNKIDQMKQKGMISGFTSPEEIMTALEGFAGTNKIANGIKKVDGEILVSEYLVEKWFNFLRELSEYSSI